MPQPKKTKSALIQNVAPTAEPKTFMEKSDASIGSYIGVNQFDNISKAGRGRDFSNLTPGVSGRPGLTKEDYEAFRPEEATPKNYKEILEQNDAAYNSTGIIHNIIDLMADFSSKGIRIYHKNKKIEAFGQNWAKQVQMDERSERFVNILLRLGTTVVRKLTAKVNVKVVEELYKSRAEADMVVPSSMYKVYKKEIPWKYVFLHPATVEPVGGELAFFSTTEPQYQLVLPEKLKKIILNPTSAEREIVAGLPQDIKDAARNNRGILLPKDKTSVFYYKKDDWSKYAFPICTSILTDIQLLKKLKLADSAALDGAISNIRIFKIGNLEYKIPPTPAAVEKLASILASNTNVGQMDLIWGPDIELIESDTKVHEFLKKDKYDPTLNGIFMGLGVPPTLTGTAGSGTTNNFISLSTLIERLEYCRTILVDFWAAELNNIQKAMGFKDPFQIEFDIMNFGDASAMNALYLQMSDRGLISDEKLQTIMKLNPEVENERIDSDEKKRASGVKPIKVGPFHQPEEEGVQGQGRPKGKKDATKRKTKKFTPRSKSAMMNLWAITAQDELSDLLNPVILAKYGRKNMRSLTAKETEAADVFKFSVLSNLKPLSKINEETVAEVIDKEINMNLFTEASNLVAEFNKQNNRAPNYDELKTIRAYAYITINGETDGES